MLRKSVDNASAFTCTETTAEDWLDTPELPAKMIIELQRHAEAVSRHLHTQSAAETTEALRGFTEDRLGKNNKKLDQHENST
mmetsp:Transcript_10799/g.14535  ORF Transcript_10799/g.14535 Transcript_10799/m.14535 type:complete len:82 (+) Transcript_10799:31-276(+)